MDLGPPDAPLPPFWDSVRRRHPDVDLVLLPDEPPPEADGPDLPPGTIEAALDRVVAYAAGAWAVATSSSDPPEVRLRFGPREDLVAAVARASTHLDSSPLPALAESLASAGWWLARPEGGVPRLAGRRGGVELLASYADTGTFVLTVTSAPVPVGVDRARVLVR